jgi:hypothetical protein
MFRVCLSCAAAACCSLCWPGLAAEEHDHSTGKQGKHSEHNQAEHDAHEHHEMAALLGPYPATREASGTSWQPEATPMDGVHWMARDWSFMLHGMASVAYTDQGGRRGDEDVFSANMLMFVATHPAGPGIFGFRSMLTLEPATIGKEGYPLLLQTGETADGRMPLIDEQHAHDLFMELALTYSIPVRDDQSVFAYFGLPGEPALGPPAFMHRFSGMDNPEAPITHHWLDSTHITYGVATVGYVWRQVKVEGSVFTGREPDEERWNIESPKFDSWSARVSWNPSEAWSFQASYGDLKSPEELHPEVDAQRLTVSATYHRKWKTHHWQTTAAWGQNRNDPGRSLDAFLAESAVRFHDTHTVFARAENVEKDELFPEGDPVEGRKFTVNKLSLGYIYDFPRWKHFKAGVGGVGSAHLLPDSLDSAYDDTPLSFLIFLRAKL